MPFCPVLLEVEFEFVRLCQQIKIVLLVQTDKWLYICKTNEAVVSNSCQAHKQQKQESNAILDFLHIFTYCKEWCTEKLFEVELWSTLCPRSLTNLSTPSLEFFCFAHLSCKADQWECPSRPPMLTILDFRLIFTARYGALESYLRWSSGPHFALAIWPTYIIFY